MTDKSWKAYERRVALLLGGERVPITGRQRGSSPDVKHDWLSIECKVRKILPEWIEEAYEQAEAASEDIRTPIVVLNKKGRDTLKSYVLIRLEDFIALVN